MSLDWSAKELGIEESYSVGEFDDENGTMIVTWRPSMSRLAGNPFFGTLVGVLLRFDADENVVQARLGTFQQAQRIAARLKGDLERDALAFDSYVRLGRSFREQLFYTRDLRECESRIAAVLQESESLQSLVRHEEDPDWHSFRSVIEAA